MKRILTFSCLLTVMVSTAAFAGQPVVATATTIFPPTNVGAGGGFLFFPAGGANSLYAAPVLADPSMISAINAQTEAIKALTAEVKTAATAQSTDCTAVTPYTERPDNPLAIVICVNKRTGHGMAASIERGGSFSIRIP